MSKSERASFGSKLGIILATAGSAVGLGNVWRFPYMAGDNGGALFIFVYLACVLLLGIPGMMSEFIIGRHAQTNAARAYSLLGGHKAWRLVGILGVVTGFLIASYYVVVSGWCLEYIFASASGQLQGDPQYIQHYFSSFTSHPWKPALWVVVFFALSHFIVVKGIEKGIERASKLLMPALFIILIILVVASCLLPGASKGIAFLFKPDVSSFSKDVFLGALGQSFYSLSLGMGCLVTYASYFNRQTNLMKSAVQIASLDTIVAILAGLLIFPAAFSVGVNPDSGPSLVFITLPNVFQQAFSAVPIVGNIVSVLFYALLSLAALTSLISLHEVCTAFLHEELKLSRNRAVLFVTVTCTVIGIFCAYSLAGYEGLSLFGRPLFDVFDFVTGQLFLPIGGFLTSIFLGWCVPKSIVMDELSNGGTLRSCLFEAYFFCVRFVCPVSIALIFLHQLGVV